MSVNELIAFGGLGLGAAQFLINWYYKHKSYALERKKNDR